MARLASFSSYAPARAFLNNLNSDSLKYIDLTFHIKRINADKLIKINPRWFAVYTDEEGGARLQCSYPNHWTKLFQEVGKDPFGAWEEIYLRETLTKESKNIGRTP